MTDKVLIPRSMSESQNNSYVGLPNELVNVVGVGLAIHNGITAGGTIYKNRPAVNENLLRNSTFAILQNGNSWQGNTGDKYIADGWWLNHAGGSTSNAVKSTSDNKGILLVTSLSSGADNSYTQLVQGHNRVQKFSGAELSWSGYISSTTPRSVAFEVVTASGILFVGRSEIESGETFVHHTFTLPKLPGSSLGTVIFRIWLEAGYDYNSRTGGLQNFQSTFSFRDLKVEYGDQATQNIVSYQKEEEDVKFYYEKATEDDLPLFISGPLGLGENGFSVINYKFPKFIGGGVTYTTQFTNSSTLYTQSKWFAQILTTHDGSDSLPRVTAWQVNVEPTVQP